MPRMTPVVPARPYMDDASNRGRSGYASHPAGLTPGHDQANVQQMPYRPRPPPAAPPQTTTHLQPPAFSPTGQEASQPAQRNAHRSTSSERLAYPAFDRAHSREDLSIPQRAGQAHTRTVSVPPVPSKPPTFDTRSAVPGSQDPGVDLGTSSHATAGSASDIPNDDASPGVSATCDGCLNSIFCSQPRVQCTECYDYDLCISCFQSSRTSKKHKISHKISHVVSTQRLCQEELIPPRDGVNPQYNPDKTKTYWDIVTLATNPTMNGGETRHCRMIHLHGNDSHARFLTSARPGHFAIVVCLELHISSFLSKADRETLQETGAGWLRVSLGTLHNKKDFYTGRYREDKFDSLVMTNDSLPVKLLKDSWYEVVRIPVDQQIIQIVSDAVISVEGPQGSLADLGLILQWSGVSAFESRNEAVVVMNIDNIRYIHCTHGRSILLICGNRLDDLLDYNEPLIRAPLPNAPKQAPVSSPAPATAAPAAPTAEDSDDEETEEISLADWIAAMAQIQQEVQDARQRAILVEALRQRAEQEDREKYEAILKALLLRDLINRYGR
jgi:hypothetical protein